MPTFPRTLPPATSQVPKLPGGLLSIGQSGGVQGRSQLRAGGVWTETWNYIDASSVNGAALISFITENHNTMATFDILHQQLPGAGKAPNGAQGGTPLVKGATESGTTLETDAWSNGIVDVVVAGDVFTVNGLNTLFRVTANATSDGSGNASILINPPILAGFSPADNAPLTITGATIRAIVLDYTIPRTDASERIMGMSCTFRESP